MELTKSCHSQLGHILNINITLRNYRALRNNLFPLPCLPFKKVIHSLLRFYNVAICWAKLNRSPFMASGLVLRFIKYFYLTPTSWTSKIRTEFAGIKPLPISWEPYARDAGIISLRFPPTFIPATPSSQPLITCPAPSWKLNG